ncbi:uncharacterized protein LOC120348268 [Styela clava]
MQYTSLVPFLLLASFQSIVISQSTLSDNAGKTSPLVVTTEKLSMAEKIQNAFKFMMLPTPTTPATETQKYSTTTPMMSKDDATTEYDFFTVFETTNESPTEDVVEVQSTRTLPVTAPSGTKMSTNSTQTTTSGNNGTTDYVYDFITVLASTFEPEDEEYQTTTAPSTTIKVLFNTTTAGETSAVSTNAKPKKPGFNFVLLNNPTTKEVSIPSTTTTTAVIKDTTEIDNEEQTTDFAFMTVFETTEEPGKEKVTTPVATTTSSTRRRTVPTPKTTHSTTNVPARKTTLPKRPKTTSKRTENGDSVYEFKNTGIKFIIKSSTASPKTKKKTSSSTKKPKFSAKTDHPEIWENLFTTDEANGGIAIGGEFIDGIIKDDYQTEAPVVAGVPWNGSYFPHPAKFWAKHWYWILIILLLIIFLFIIPGFFCQIYLSKWCKKRKLHEFFRKRSPTFTFDRIGRGIGIGRKKTVSEKEDDYIDVEKGHESSSFSSSGVSSQSARKSSVSSIHTHPAASVHAADIDHHRSHESKTTEQIVSTSENATVIFIPDPMSNVRITALSGSHMESVSQPNQSPSFDFPEPVMDDSNHPPPMSDVPASIRSQSDIGLDIGNEAIIKSNNMTNLPTAVPLQPPHRPPKPEHMAPKPAPGITAPENRPKRRSKKKKPSKKNSDKLRNEGPPPRRHRDKKDDSEASQQRKRRTRERTGDRSTKKSKNSTKKRPTRLTEKHVSSTQSLMHAAKSLEDILDAITKLTREYPVPDLPELSRPVKEKSPQEKTHRPQNTDRVHKNNVDGGKDPEQNERHIPDKDMMRRKQKRTKHWATEQQKIDRSRDKKRRKEEKQQKRSPSSRRRKKKEERQKTKKEKTRTPRGEIEEKKEPKKKVPTLKKEDVTPQDRTKQERRRLRLERDLKKLQKYHNTVAKKEEESAESVAD